MRRIAYLSGHEFYRNFDALPPMQGARQRPLLRHVRSGARRRELRRMC